MGPRFLGREVRGVVFDLDGVLAPTLSNHVKAYREVLARLDVPVEHMEVARREGQRSHEIIAWIAEKHGKMLGPDEAMELAKEKNAIYRGYPKPPLYPDVVPTLDLLNRLGLRVGLATGTHRANIPHILGDVTPRFHATVAAEDVTLAKPDPEPYLKAAAALGLPPADCVVVENAPLGVSSGKEAGARVVALTTTLDAKYLEEADLVVGSLGEFAKALEAGR